MIPLLSELVELYKEGKLPQSNHLVYYDTEEKRKLGETYAMFMTWDMFLITMELNKKFRERLMNKLFNDDKEY